MNHHSLPVKELNHAKAKAILGWNHSLNEFFAHVYVEQDDGLLGDLLYSTTADQCFPSEVEGLDAWLKQKAVVVPTSVLTAVKDDQLKRESNRTARYDILGKSLDSAGFPVDEEPLLMKGVQLMLC